MARQSKPAALASSEPILQLVPDMPVAGAPARDLTGGDLEYLARVRALSASGGIPPKKAIGDAEIAALADDLVKSGAFKRAEKKRSSPARAASPKPEPQAAQEPAAPAEEN